jgi:hypothetical protein
VEVYVEEDLIKSNKIQYPESVGGLSVPLYMANAIIAGARNARGGERACPAEGSEGVIHLFEPVVGF